MSKIIPQIVEPIVTESFNIATIVPWVALLIALFSLFINSYRIYRDKHKLVTWSEIITKCSMENNKEYPVLRIYAVNIGLRPITLTEFGFYAKSKKHYIGKNIKPLEDIPSDIFDPEFESKISQKSLAHENKIRLEDGDIYEMQIKYDEFDMFYDTYNENAELAKQMYFKDILGKKYYIKDSENNIKILNNYKE